MSRLTMAVSITPGASAFTVIPLDANRRESARASPTSAPFAME